MGAAWSSPTRFPTRTRCRASVVERAIEQALREAQAQGIAGKAVTPFLLARVNALTGGDSLASNVQLVLNNARLAAGVAAAYGVCQSS